MVALGHLASYLASYLFSQALPLHPLLASFPQGCHCTQGEPKGESSRVGKSVGAAGNTEEGGT